MKNVLIDIRAISKHFRLRHHITSGRHVHVKALDGIDLQIREGETLGLVGESGCGKTTLGRLITMLETPTEGRIFFDGKDINGFSKEMRKAYRREVQLIFQDPISSLNPRMTAGSIIEEPFIVNGLARGKERTSEVLRIMEAVGLRKEHGDRYPHEFSGGQRQRIGIARALALRPRLIVADEPVSALDVSIQAQILNLLRKLQHDFMLTYLFISHDLSVVGHISDRIAVMYLGRIVELADSRDLFARPLHPYTEALLSAVPVPNPEWRRKRLLLSGDMPSPISPPTGCPFHPRCPYRMEICAEAVPSLEEKKADRFAACHLRR